MKLSFEYLILLSAVALASPSVALAEDVAVTSDAANTAAEAKIVDAVEAAADDENGDADAGKECAADGSCAPERGAAAVEA